MILNQPKTEGLYVFLFFCVHGTNLCMCVCVCICTEEKNSSLLQTPLFKKALHLFFHFHLHKTPHKYVHSVYKDLSMRKKKKEICFFPQFLQAMILGLGVIKSWKKKNRHIWCTCTYKYKCMYRRIINQIVNKNLIFHCEA